MKLLRNAKGLCLIEFAVLSALLLGVMLPAIAMIADNVLDILNDLAEDLDAIDDLVAEIDLGDTVEMPESNEDNDSHDDDGGAWAI